MNVSKLLRQPSLTDQVFQILIDRIQEGIYPPDAQLPTENELIKEFSISKVTLRSAFAKLEERRLIQRRQGIGTFVTGQLSIVNPLYQVIDFNDRITKQGFKSGFKQVDAKVVTTDADIANKLGIDAGSPTLRIEKIWTADDQPNIYVVNHIPLWVFEGHSSIDEITQPGLTEPFYLFFMQKCNIRIDYLNSCLLPEIVDNCDLPEEFSAYPLNTPVLVIEDIGFTAEGKPVFHSLEHLLGAASRIETVRRVL